MVAPPDNDVLWARNAHYSHRGSPALTNVSLGVGEGEIVAVLGPRGSGKTTLLRCLSGQLVPQQGEVWFNSSPVHTLRPMARERLRLDRFSWIDPEPRLVPELTVWENAALPLLLKGTSHRAAKHAAAEWLERLDVGMLARKRPHALLQAQRQRVAVARALVAMPSVLFADEPTAALHRAEGAQVLRTLTTAARTHRITVVVATQDAEVAAHADRTIGLQDGRRVTALGASDEADRGGRAECSLSV
ncbi:ATP-binding cassette domain-containing protein [Streptomyces sp. NPDC051322]|uniref:ABC transporter ATP-binding protein n=1 Tax=Streptomyces sp. NPDC051322 TaxID=3154645 RepID=UPI00344F7C89